MLPNNVITPTAKKWMTATLDGGHILPHLVRAAQKMSLRRLCTATRSLVLTYDDGPGYLVTARLLDLLSSAGHKAVFFPLGRQAAEYGHLLDRMVGDGHEVGCHGQDHVHAWRAWPWEAVQDMELGYQSVAPWVKPDAVFRPPHGKLTVPTWLCSRWRGRSLGWWTLDSGDTHDPLPENPQSVADSAARSGGGVVLMHDFHCLPKQVDYVLQTTELLFATAKREGLTIRRFCDLHAVHSPDAMPCCPS
jgi:peptidoglycan-N-acetylglucosamine deacetylase